MITWAEIETEAGGFRAGLVAIFRKYEGQPTDEKDLQGRTVKVTSRSFADHMGIAERTFRRWVKSAAPAATAGPSDLTRQTRLIRSAVRNEPDAVVDAIMEVPSEHQDKIYHELKLRRAGIDTSEPTRKAAEAQTGDAIEPIYKGLALIPLAGMAEQLDEMADDLRKAVDDGANVGPALPKIRAALERFGGVLELAELVTGARVE